MSLIKKEKKFNRIKIFQIYEQVLSEKAKESFFYLSKN
jgi:hypothetical protein